MALFEDVIITDAVEIKTTPEEVFKFLTGIVDDDTYRAWHPQDHLCFRWLKGKPWAEGSVVYAEEMIHGKRHKLKFKVTRIVLNQRIEYTPVSRFLRKFFPKNEFIIEQKGDSCLFTASGTYRLGWIGKKFFRKAIDKGLSSVRQHMREEGQNMQRTLENAKRAHSPQACWSASENPACGAAVRQGRIKVSERILK